MGKLDGKVALITGGSEGIGFSTAEHFLAEGAEHLFITGRRQNALDAAVQNLKSNRVTAVKCDSSNLSDLDRLYEIIKSEKQRLDVIFVNAGVCSFAKFGTVSEEHFDHTFNVNVKGVFFTIQKALPILTDGASVILNGSNSSIKGDPELSAYCASKAALRAFARCWIVDLKGRGIRVNILSPGAIDTPLLRSLGQDEADSEKWMSEWAKASPLDRIGKPEEIAKVAVFLASNDSSFITGVELFVDGGLSQI